MDLRCFIAIEIPPSVKESVAKIINTLRKFDTDIKWVSSENIHITLKFLGQTDESLINPIKDSLIKKLLPYNSFYIRIYGTGCFPGAKHPRVIWVGIEEAEFLKKLQKDIEDEMVKFGFPSEKRSYSPHLTIGRVRSQNRIQEFTRILNEFRTHSFGNFEVKNITLMESKLKPEGAQYYRLAEIPFGGRNNVK